MAIRSCRAEIGTHKALPDVPVNTAWDIGVGDENAIWFWQKNGPRLRTRAAWVVKVRAGWLGCT